MSFGDRLHMESLWAEVFHGLKMYSTKSNYTACTVHSMGRRLVWAPWCNNSVRTQKQNSDSGDQLQGSCLGDER